MEADQEKIIKCSYIRQMIAEIEKRHSFEMPEAAREEMTETFYALYQVTLEQAGKSMASLTDHYYPKLNDICEICGHNIEWTGKQWDHSGMKPTHVAKPTGHKL